MVFEKPNWEAGFGLIAQRMDWNASSDVSGLTIEDIQALCGSHPECAVLLFEGRLDLIAAEAQGVVLAVLIANRLSGSQVQARKLLRRGEPDDSSGILVDLVNLALEEMRIPRVGTVSGEPLRGGVVAVQELV